MLGNLGRTYHDSFFWEVGSTTYLLEVAHRGAYHHWQPLPPGWDNPHFGTASALKWNNFQPGQLLTRPVTTFTQAEKLLEAMWRSRRYLGAEALGVWQQLVNRQTAEQLLTLSIIYGISLFFGVGEVVTGVVVIAGYFFAGQVVVEVLESLVSCVKVAIGATTEAELDQAAHLFAHALTLGLAVVAALLLHKAVARIRTHVPEGVVRRGGTANTGKKRPLALPSPAESKPPVAPPKTSRTNRNHTYNGRTIDLESSPIRIPKDAKVIEQTKTGYEQVKYTWEENGVKYEARWHSRTPKAPPEQGDTWVITKTTPGTPTGQRKPKRF